MEVEINLVAVVLAMISSLVVGSIWYNKSVFGKSWVELARLDPKILDKPQPVSIAITMVASLITAYVLAHVTYLSYSFFDYSFLQSALTTAFWLWLGLTAARLLTHEAFENRPAKLILISLGNEFVTIMVMGLVIGLLGV